MEDEALRVRILEGGIKVFAAANALFFAALALCEKAEKEIEAAGLMRSMELEERFSLSFVVSFRVFDLGCLKQSHLVQLFNVINQTCFYFIPFQRIFVVVCLMFLVRCFFMVHG